MRYLKIVALVFLSCVLLLASGCRPSRGSDGGVELNGEIVEAVRGDLTVSVSGSGRLEAVTDIKLAFDKGGEVSKLYVEAGDEVSRGLLLAVRAPTDEEALELAVTQAEVALLQAQYNLDEVENPYTEEEIEEAEQAVEDAEDFLDLAEDMLRYVLQHGGQWEVLQWQMEVLNAEIRLEMAEDKLDDMLNERDEDQIVVLRAQVAAAEQALAEAQRALERDWLVAPFTGVVAEVYVEEGNVIPPPTVSQVPIVRIIDATRMELLVEVDEIDIPNVKIGQEAVMNVDALPDVEIAGKVLSVHPLPTVESGVVLYDVEIGFNVPRGSQLRAGMSTTADIVLQGSDNALILPHRAIEYDSQGSPLVRLVVEDEASGTLTTREQAVVIGISDGFYTEVLSGLSEGDRVLVERESEPESGGGLFFQ